MLARIYGTDITMYLAHFRNIVKKPDQHPSLNNRFYEFNWQNPNLDSKNVW